MASGFTCVGYWDVESNALDEAVACSASGGAVVRAVGNTSWKGRVRCYGKEPPATLKAGSYFEFTGYDSAGKGWRSQASLTTTGAYAESARIVVPISTGRPIHYEVGIVGNGKLETFSGGSPDANAANPAPSRGLKVYWGADLANLIHAELLIRAPGEIGWDGSVTEGWAYCLAGNVDGQLMWRQAFDDPTAIPKEGDIEIARLYVDDSTYWECEWMKLMEKRPVYAADDGQGQPKVVAVDVIAAFTGYKAGAPGHIKSSAGQYWFGSA